MNFSFFAILSILVAYCRVSAEAASADCFRQTGPITESSSKAARISTGVVCSKTENRTCAIVPEGYVNASSTLNISTTHATDVLDTIGKSFNVTFDHARYENISGVSFGVQPGTNAYISYNFPLRCYTGVIDKDCFDDIPAGVPVEACQAVNDTTFKMLVGTYTTVGTDEVTARNMTDNPALDIKPDESDTVPTLVPTPVPSPSPSPISGAINLLGQGSWPSSILTMTIVVIVVTMGNYVIAL